MYVYEINSENKNVTLFYKSLYISSETSSGIAINQITYSSPASLEINNLVEINTEPTLKLPITK